MGYRGGSGKTAHRREESYGDEASQTPANAASPRVADGDHTQGSPLPGCPARRTPPQREPRPHEGLAALPRSLARKERARPCPTDGRPERDPLPGRRRRVRRGLRLGRRSVRAGKSVPTFFAGRLGSPRSGSHCGRDRARCYSSMRAASSGTPGKRTSGHRVAAHVSRATASTASTKDCGGRCRCFVKTDPLAVSES